MKPFRSRMGVGVLSIAAIAAGYFGARPLIDQVQFARAASDVDLTRQQLSTVEDLSTVFKHVGKVVQPSVVKISVRKLVQGTNQTQIPEQFRQFFGGPGGPAMPDQGPQEEDGTGSGVIMEASGGYGYILTNNHVAGDATEVDVFLSDGREIDNAKVLGTDPKSDLAVVQIKADRLIPAVWGNSDDMQQGDWVLAFGSPFGYVGSMTHGIISALNRENVDMPDPNTIHYQNFIQVDAPINPGNSGGPLVNLHGEVIGIDTAIATNTGAFEGIGFAIPSNQAHDVYTQLKSNHKVVRGWLGVSIADVAGDNLKLARSYHFTGDNGVLIEDTIPNTPAVDKLQPGDIVTAVNGKAIENSDQLRNMVAGTAPGTTITVKVWRDSKSQNVDLVVGEQPDSTASLTGGENQPGQAAPQAGPTSTLGMKFQTLDRGLATQLGLPAQIRPGAAVLSVDHDSVAAKELTVGDVITSVNGTAVRSAEDAASMLSAGDLKTGIRVMVANRNGRRIALLQSENAGGN